MAKSSADTPVMRQFLEIKGQHPDAILFFRMGDFYEMFFEDAVTASRLLELTLTSRDKGSENPVPMCGVPHHAANGYVRRLLDAGHKVAICDQVEDPRTARGIVRRAVTQVVTPGVVLDTEHLDAKQNNFLAVIVARGRRYGLAALDLSTFELYVAELASPSALLDELARLAPREVLHEPRATEALAALQQLAPGAWHAGEEALFGKPAEDRALFVAGTDADEAGLAFPPLGVAAAAAALRYAAATQPTRSLPLCRISSAHDAEHLLLDEAALRNLEILASSTTGGRAGSLLAVVDHTLTAMGARLLRRTLARPLADVGAIRRRHDAVEALVEQPALNGAIRAHLERVYDLERLTSRVVLQVASPRELRRLGDSLAELPGIAQQLGELAGARLDRDVPQLLRWPTDLLRDVAQLLAEALVDEPPVIAKTGGLFRRGFDAELDEVIDLCDGGRTKILEIEQREREATGIASLKVRYNKVFGYFIEVTRSNLKLVPEHYRRKQTVANAERFVTDELVDHEAKILAAQERRSALEERHFEALRRRVGDEGGRLAAAAERVALLDLLCGLAELAQRRGYVRPEIDEGAPTIEILEGRHPVVERCMPAGEFVPNDVRLDEQNRLLILTGPNMAGKSTVMRQVALIAVLAQSGSFVPCRSCRLGLLDRVFTRVGASDQLTRGDSTFMVEMRETAAILQHATERSLVILDEIGRGTATYDGISIAWAVAEHLHDRIRALTMFATHYHELCALAEVKERATNLTIAVQEWKGNVVFLRKLVPGAASRSYGLEVARLAGLDRAVLGRARAILRALEEGEVVQGFPLRARRESPQLGLFAPRAAPAPRSAGSELVARLAALEVQDITPLEGLNLLAELVDEARQEQGGDGEGPNDPEI